MSERGAIVVAAGSRLLGVKIGAIAAVILAIGALLLMPVMAMSMFSDGKEPGAQKPDDRDGGALPVSPEGDKRELAAQIVQLIQDGRVSFLSAAHQNQVETIANPDMLIHPSCDIDPRILQLVIVAANEFDTVQVSSLNRRCTGERFGIGEASMHWQGRAFDFSAINGVPLTGSDPSSLHMIQILDRIAPADAGIGQLGCGYRGDVTSRIAEYADSCNHLHFELGWSNDPLQLPSQGES